MISRNEYKAFISTEEGSTMLPEGYLYTLSKYDNINIGDILLAFVEILNPEFDLYEDKIFLRDRFFLYEARKDNFQSVAQGQYWTNLIEMTELYADIGDDNAMVLAKLIADAWNRKINALGWNEHGFAKLMDDELGTFVTICGHEYT